MQSVRKKLKLLNINNNRKEKYSDKWLLKINPLAIAKYIQRKKNQSLSWRAARAIADAEIAEVYRDLVLEEEQLNLQEETIEGRCEE
mgnify:CR=1 FL=1|jgi:hypothetical protein|tara:strand:- start:988 stop:1248 length:261 start_codon:yes stop_codon:yes gene_type:complete